MQKYGAFVIGFVTGLLLAHFLLAVRLIHLLAGN